MPWESTISCHDVVSSSETSNLFFADTLYLWLFDIQIGAEVCQQRQRGDIFIQKLEFLASLYQAGTRQGFILLL